MKKIRYASVVLGVALIIAIIAFTQAFVASSNTEKSSLPILGMGDLHVAESQQEIIPVTGVQRSSQPYKGIGDLRLFEASQVTPVSASNSRYIGMGDLHLLESR